jgi:hypothetical protein
MSESELRQELAQLRREVQELRDRQEIQDCLVGYSRGLDRHDSELLSSIYHDDAIDHHGDFLGSPADFVPWVNDLHEAGYVAHQHFVANNTVEIDGDVAHSEIYVQVVLRRKDGPLDICGGRYVDRLERREGRWRIAARETLVDWACTVEGEIWPAIGVFPMGAWDRSDASYQRPLQVPAESTRLLRE